MKKGTHTVGVQRQYNDTAGRIENAGVAGTEVAQGGNRSCPARRAWHHGTMTDGGEHVHSGPPRRRNSSVGAPAKQAEHRASPARASFPPGPASNARLLWLQSTTGNTATRRLVPNVSRTGLPSLQRGPGSPAPAPGVTPPSPAPPVAPPSSDNRLAFVREEGLNLRAAPDQASNSMAQLPFGTRVHVIEDELLHPEWQKVTTPAAAVGFLYAKRVHFPPPDLIARDPGTTMFRVRSGQTFWGLVKEQYGIEGNESTADQNINHFINAIRVVNKGDAFIVHTDWLDDIGNWLISGRDASDTLLKAGYDLWIPSFGVAAAMDVGSGTVTGEAARIVKKIEQKIEDFCTACSAAVQYVPEAITRHAGEAAMGLVTGLIDFAIDAAKILAVSTAVGALIGALFGGVGAVPGAEIGFEIGLMILEYYGLAMLIEAILRMAGSLVTQLGSFISQVWNANGDAKRLDTAGKTLADALGILVSALLMALAAYLMKKGGDALAKSKFAGKVGETQLARWLADRQKMKTTTETLGSKKNAAPSGGTEPLPELRQKYIGEVEALLRRRDAMRAAGESPETIARTLHAERRELGVKYKDLTPEPLRSQIYARNAEKYGDPLGPSIEWLRSRGKSWEAIIESATRSGGADLGLGKK